ncbi:hypothetical protein KTS45_08850 [Halomicroarcula limicola]|uniref:Uncharacterized protein n=1 Tax=Haloarcula limicola TaxID=1429915 RepID=A0A8J7YD56_9EURY|nr:DUF5810 domain-containing protein [Halomicroarcula limicola]MBV0924308.1 hypothetical protein [Halomicroarcula limicola]
MGYACPVCDDPQADARHLANHLAFTAMTSGGDHESWLDDHVENWGQLGENELAEEVTAHAEETEFPQVFEESGVDSGHDHDHDHGRGGVPGEGDLPPGTDSHRGQRSMSDEDREVLAEARDLTREMLDNESEDGESGDEGDGTDGQRADGDATGDETE